MSDISDENKGSNADAKTGTSEEHYEQQLEKLLSLQKQQLITQAPSTNWLKGYSAFFGMVGLFGVIAYYATHNSTLQWIFGICAIMLIFVPLKVSWDFAKWYRDKRKALKDHSESQPEDRLSDYKPSGLTQFLTRILNSPVSKYFPYIFFPLMIALVLIIGTPASRSMILFVSFFMALLGITGIGDLLTWYINFKVKELWDNNNRSLQIQIQNARLQEQINHNFQNWHFESRDAIVGLANIFQALNQPPSETLENQQSDQLSEVNAVTEPNEEKDSESSN